MHGVPILMYHALEDPEHPAGAIDPGEQRYVLQVRQFADQMSYLKREGYQTLLFKELLMHQQFPEKTVVITFDDGHESNFLLALPILQGYGFKAEFFITSGWVGKPHFMTNDQVKCIQRAGMGIGSHGVTHAFMEDLNLSELERELSESKQMLETITGVAVNTFSAPGGRIHPQMGNIARRLSFHYLFTSTPDLFFPDSSRYAIPRLSVLSRTSDHEFADIVKGDGSFISGAKKRNAILGRLKSIMGNSFYERFRNILLSFKSS